MREKRYKIVVYAPPSHAAAVRDAIGLAGAGVIGNYTDCSFTIRGTTRFRPGPGSDPNVGAIGRLAEVEEDRIETVCTAAVLKNVIESIRSAHPHEEPAMDVYPIEVV